MWYNSFLFSVFGLFGFYLGAMLAFSGKNGSFISSHVIARACDDSNPAVQGAGIVAGITVCGSMLFLYGWLNYFRDPSRRWNLARKIVGYITIVGFIATAWTAHRVSTDKALEWTQTSTFHKVVGALAVFSSTAFALLNWIRYIGHPKISPGLLYLKGITAIGCALSVVMLGIFFFTSFNTSFAIFQGFHWIFFCLSGLGLVADHLLI